MSKIRPFLVLLLSFVVASSVQAGGSWESSNPPTGLWGKNWQSRNWQKVMKGKVTGVRAKAASGRSVTHHYNQPYDVQDTLPLPAGPWVEVELILADGVTTQSVSLDGALLRIGSQIVGDAVAEDAVIDSGLILFGDELWPDDGGPPAFTVSFRVE